MTDQNNKQDNSDTPETNAEAAIVKNVPIQIGLNGIAFMKAECVPSWLSRKLERERDSALLRIKELEQELKST